MTGDAMASPYAPVRKLAATDQVDGFDCGQGALNQFVQRYALVNQKSNSAQTYVCCQSDVVVGFYGLAVGSVEPEAASSRVVKGLARHPVPALILARLAVDKDHQQKGLGQALLKDACAAAHGAGRRHRRYPLPAGTCQGRCSAAVVRVLGIRAQSDRSFITSS